MNSLDACQQRCLVRPGCKGVAFSAAGCQLWTRAFGIGATAPEAGLRARGLSRFRGCVLGSSALQAPEKPAFWDVFLFQGELRIIVIGVIRCSTQIDLLAKGLAEAGGLVDLVWVWFGDLLSLAVVGEWGAVFANSGSVTIPPLCFPPPLS